MNTAPKQFYYQLDGSVIGPVTGIELRNAALAGNVTPRTLVANDPNGEWLLAVFVNGLFDEGGTPLPHPPETSQFLEGNLDTRRVEQRATTDSTATSGFSDQPKQFYFKHDGIVIGPVTGIELRDAALSGKVIPRTLVANDPNGKWLLAVFVSGLFDDGGTPLPHPPETSRLLSDGNQATQPGGQQDEYGSVATSGVSEQPRPFYFKHEGNVIGPMTGAELREHAFVGNVIPTTVVANDPNGQWVVANCLRGLFDEIGRPLPHPKETRRLFNEQESPLHQSETRGNSGAIASNIQPATNSAHGGPTNSPQLSGDSISASQSRSTAVELCPHCSREVARMPELAGTLVACPYCAREFRSGGAPRQQGLPQVVTTPSRLRKRRSRHRGGP